MKQLSEKKKAKLKLEKQNSTPKIIPKQLQFLPTHGHVEEQNITTTGPSKDICQN